MAEAQLTAPRTNQPQVHFMFQWLALMQAKHSIARYDPNAAHANEFRQIIIFMAMEHWFSQSCFTKGVSQTSHINCYNDLTHPNQQM